MRLARSRVESEVGGRREVVVVPGMGRVEGVLGRASVGRRAERREKARVVGVVVVGAVRVMARRQRRAFMASICPSFIGEWDSEP
jgi:hypothetical protein